MASKTPSAKKSYHHGDLDRALIAKAIELTEEHGLSGWSLTQAAKALGVSTAAPYRHFKNRDELLAAVAAHGMVRVRDRMINAMRHAGNDPAAQFHAICWCMVRFAIEQRAEYQITFSGARKDTIGTLQAAGPHSSFRTLIDAIIQWQAVGFVKAGDPTSVGISLWAAVHGLASLLASGRLTASGPKAKALCRELVGRLLVGIGRA